MTKQPATLRAWLGSHASVVLVAVLLVFFLLVFMIVEVLQIPLLIDPIPALRSAGPLAAVGSVGLLVVDVVLPMPASVIMIANGALFGVVPGSLLSFAGGLGATLLAFWIGRRSRHLLQTVIPSAHEQRANALLARYGPLAIVITRPLPIVAETVAILAGRSDLTWGQVVRAGAIGNVVPAVLYALAGAAAVTTVSAVVVFGAALLASAIFWLTIRKAWPSDSQAVAPKVAAPQGDASVVRRTR